MTETEINQKVTEVLNLMKGISLKEYKEIIRFVDTDVQTKFKL